MDDRENPVEVICRYRIKPGEQERFEELIARHWKTLHDVGLPTDEPARVYRGSDHAGNVAYVEMFSWKTEGSAQTAHETPAVMQLWEPMGALCEDMEFWHAEAIGG